MKYLLMSLILHRVILRSSTVVLQVVHFHSPLQLKIVSCMYPPRFFILFISLLVSLRVRLLIDIQEINGIH